MSSPIGGRPCAAAFCRGCHDQRAVLGHPSVSQCTKWYVQVNRTLLYGRGDRLLCGASRHARLFTLPAGS